MTSIAYINPETMASNPAFSQAVRIPAGHDLIVIGGQNGVDATGAVVGDDLKSQTRQALDNLSAAWMRPAPSWRTWSAARSW